MRGILNPSSIAFVMREVAATGKEGLLHLVCEDVAKRIYLKDGLVIFAGSDSEDERLGTILVRAGKMSEGELTGSLDRAKRTGDILGKVLVESGVVSPDDVEEMARERTVSIVASAFRWPTGHYFFQEKPTEVRKEVALDLSIERVLFEAGRSAPLDFARRSLTETPSTLRRCGPEARSTELASDPAVGWILDHAGDQNVRELMRTSPAGEEKTLRALYGLVLAGLFAVETLVGSTADLGDVTEGSMAGMHVETLPKPVPTELGRYEVVKLLGRGAMGAVYLARDPVIDRTVAVKLIQTVAEVSAAEFEKYRERFHREAKAAGQLSHPGIVAIFDLGYTEEGTPFIVMEHVEGRTLRDVVAVDGPDIDTLLRYAVEILVSLSYAHENGIVHRDIKPTNILVANDGRVKLMDFGIAHVLGSELTKEHDVLGSPNYMAPEQLTKAPVDARTDLFAFGVLLYWMLTQKLPFTGDSIPAIAQAIVNEEPRAPHSVRADVDPSVSAIVMRCVAKEPAARFATANDVRVALAAAVRGEAGTPTIRSSSVHTGRLISSRSTTLPRLVTAIIVAAVLALAAVILIRPQSAIVQSVRPGGALEASLVSMSDEELYQRAARTLADGDLEASRSILTALLRRNPTFEGAVELSVQTIPDSEEDGRAAVDEASDVDAQLFYDARLAFDRGQLSASTEHLDTLLRNNPSFIGAAQLLVDVNDAKWRKALPQQFSATHNHRLGGCEGALTLHADKIEFVSGAHDWSWSFDDIRTISVPSQREIVVGTHEIDLLTLGRPKNYKFSVEGQSPTISWSRYERLFHGR